MPPPQGPSPTVARRTGVVRAMPLGLQRVTPQGFPGGSVVKNPPANADGKIPWRRKWQPPPGFLSGESHGQRGLVSYSPRAGKEGMDPSRSGPLTSCPAFPRCKYRSKHARNPALYFIFHVE